MQIIYSSHKSFVFDHNDNLLLLFCITYIMELHTPEQELNHIEGTYWGDCPFVQSLHTIMSHELTKI